jgi:hypothetical protein
MRTKRHNQLLFITFAVAMVTLISSCKKDEQPKPALTYLVVFNPNGGKPSPDVQVVDSAKTATQPDEIKLEHYNAYGWSIDANGTEMFDFSTPITDDINLYAQLETDETAFTTRPASEAGDGATITSGVEITGLIDVCKSAQHVTIPAMIGGQSVTGIASEAFMNDTYMVSLKLPEGLISIGKNWFTNSSTFKGCINLKSIIIPSSVTQIGVSAFESCTGMEKFEFTEPSNFTDFGYNVFLYCSSLKELQLPSSLTKVFTYLFNGCTGLEKITLPSSITEIQDQAFRFCTSLNTVVIKREASAGITKLATGTVFDLCDSLTTIKVPANSVIDYKIAKNWVKFKDLIVPAD